MRICNVCKNEKDLEEFHRTKSFPLGRVYTCKPCAKDRSRKWNKENKKRKKEQGEKHYQNNRKTYIERAVKAEWYKNNTEKAREARKRRYRRTNGAAYVAYYRNLRKRATPLWLTDSQKEEIENFYWMCKDLKSITGENYHVDHIVPVKGENICGLHVPWNLQILPADINIKKSNTFGY